MDSMTPPPPDDELPPPPDDLESAKKAYPPIKSRKPSPMRTLGRALTIFEKDMRTVAKHGLVSAIILLVFLGIVFYILGYAMQQSIILRFDDESGNGVGPLPGSTDTVRPVANIDLGPNAVSANTIVNLDASGSTDNTALVYYVWDFSENGRDVQLYGETVQHDFSAVGKYNITLTVVDSSWNMAQANATLTVTPDGADNQPPVAVPSWGQTVNVGTMVTLDGSNSTDNVGIVNWTWMFTEYEWKIDRTLYGERPSYMFDSAGNFQIRLVVRDAAGNTNQADTSVQVNTMGGSGAPPKVEIDTSNRVNVGDTVPLSAKVIESNASVQSYTWFIKQNNTMIVLTGSEASFTVTQQGVYEVVLGVRDSFGNTGASDTQIIVLPTSVDPNAVSWVSTPFGFDVPFNLLTYAYGIALLSSVIYIAGFFAKGFSHEITKGTIKVLFFGPISVTTMVFSKILYPIVVGPIFIFPLVLVSLSMFGNPIGDVLMITFVAYALSVVTMVAAAYGSCMIYLVTKRMSVKPSVVSRSFLYLSLVGTFTVGAWSAFLLDKWAGTERWSGIWENVSGLTAISPFHQGGVFLSNAILGTAQVPDYIVFVIPAVLIVGGVLASRKLYSDIFSRE